MLTIKNLSKAFPVKKDILGRTTQSLQAVNDVSLEIKTGECLTLVGESGCGKSTLARLILKLIQADSGEVMFEGRDILNLGAQDLISARTDMQMIFQNPFSSLDPRYKISDTIAEPLWVHKKKILRNIEEELDQYCNGSWQVAKLSFINNLKDTEIQNYKDHGKCEIDFKNFCERRVEQLLELVGLDQSFLNKFPHQCSGGQNQRIGIARALILNPKFIIADEAVSALDVSMQWKVLELIKKLKEELNISFLFIAHNLGVVKFIADRVAVMYLGEIVELADKEELFSNPLHPYTKALLNAAPMPDPKLRNRERIKLEGEIPKATDIPSGCPFHTRCPVAEAKCSEQKPALEEQGQKHFASCLLL